MKWKIIAAAAAPALVGRAILIKAINIVIFDAVDVCCCCLQYLLLIVYRDIAATLVDSDTVAVTPIYIYIYIHTHNPEKSRYINCPLLVKAALF